MILYDLNIPASNYTTELCDMNPVSFLLMKCMGAVKIAPALIHTFAE